MSLKITAKELFNNVSITEVIARQLIGEIGYSRRSWKGNLIPKNNKNFLKNNHFTTD